jgi:hypothetical protein
VGVATGDIKPVDTRQTMLNTVIDLEKKLKKLKKRLKKEEKKVKISDDDVNRLEYIQEELQEILPE